MYARMTDAQSLSRGKETWHRHDNERPMSRDNRVGNRSMSEEKWFADQFSSNMMERRDRRSRDMYWKKSMRSCGMYDSER